MIEGDGELVSPNYPDNYPTGCMLWTRRETFKRSTGIDCFYNLNFPVACGKTNYAFEITLDDLELVQSSRGTRHSKANS